MRKFGYARVSTSQQSVDQQKKLLLAEGVDPSRIYSDIGTRSNIDREGLNLLKIKVEKGDQIIITRLDRLGSDTANMIQLIQYFESVEVTVRFIMEGLSTEGSMGRMVLTILSAVAESEKCRILERTNEGRVEAMAKGIKFGRKRFVDRKKLMEMVTNKKSAATIARSLGIARSTVYKIIKEEIDDN